VRKGGLYGKGFDFHAVKLRENVIT
jgi:hypothetical protein